MHQPLQYHDYFEGQKPEFIYNAQNPELTNPFHNKSAKTIIRRKQKKNPFTKHTHSLTHIETLTHTLISFAHIKNATFEQQQNDSEKCVFLERRIKILQFD